MSLKAKLEAVIYAAEEPVTLAQLASLFAADALEWKAEQEAASAAEAESSESELGDEFAYLEPDAEASTTVETSQADLIVETVQKQDSPPEPETEAGSNVETAEETQVEPQSAAAESTATTSTPEEGAETAPATETPEAVESELKRQARLRDREVRAILRQLLDEIIDSYVTDEHGVEIREIAGGYRMATKPECHDAVRLFVKSLKPALKLSLAALETLAVIAYKQPVTAPEVNEIRGVESGGVLGSLLARKLIATAGRKQVIGRPILYKTTKEFLLRFGLKNVAELPSMEEFEKMVAIELDEPEVTVQQADQQEVREGSEEGEPNEQQVEGESAPVTLPSDSDESLQDGRETEGKEDALPMNDLDAGDVPASAETPAEQESEAAELDADADAEPGAQIDVALPVPMPAVTAAQETAETPAETAADASVAPEEPAEA
jgi:segregation and condensation protein B